MTPAALTSATKTSATKTNAASDSVASVYEQVVCTTSRWPQRPLFNVLPSTASVYGIDANELSYEQVLASADSHATRFAGAGLKRGMRVALLFENRPVFFELFLALNKLGISVVPLNPDLRVAEFTYLIGHAEPALVLSIPARIIELRAAAKEAGIDAPVVTLDDPIPVPRVSAVVARVLAGEEQEAALLYTSGTTGSPKGCVLPNSYFLLAGVWYAQLGGIARLDESGEKMITPLPLFHMNAMAVSFMAMVTVGGCLTVLDRFHPASWWDDVKTSAATCLHYLGVMPSILMRLAASDTDRDHQVRFGFGAGVDPRLQADFETRFGFPLVEAWAMTETGAGAVIAASTHDRLVGQSCLGKPTEDLACRIIGEQGNEVFGEDAGELLVRRSGSRPRYGFFSHYYKNDKATAEAWADGWFHTGDLVRQDASGNLFFVDRKKNVIRRSGENIAAVEVESVLMRHPAINAVGVAAVPDELRGDEVFACLQVNEPSEELAIEITNWGLAQMAYYKVPGYIAFIDQLPLTATQKIQRAELKKQALALLTHPQTVDMKHLKKRQPQ